MRDKSLSFPETDVRTFLLSLKATQQGTLESAISHPTILKYYMLIKSVSKITI
jgi:hypothetical protein